MLWKYILIKENMFQSKISESTSDITKKTTLLILIHIQTCNKIQKNDKFMVSEVTGILILDTRFMLRQQHSKSSSKYETLFFLLLVIAIFPMMILVIEINSGFTQTYVYYVCYSNLISVLFSIQLFEIPLCEIYSNITLLFL